MFITIVITDESIKCKKKNEEKKNKNIKCLKGPRLKMKKKKKALNKYYFSIIVHNRMKQKITFG